MIWLYLVSCIICCGLTYFHRHKMAENRGALLVFLVVACVPVLNVILWVGIAYAVYGREPFMAWLKKPLK